MKTILIFATMGVQMLYSATLDVIVRDGMGPPLDFAAARLTLVGEVTSNNLSGFEIYRICPGRKFRVSVSSGFLLANYDWRVTVAQPARHAILDEFLKALKQTEISGAEEKVDLRWGCVAYDSENKSVFSFFWDEPGTKGVVNGRTVRFKTAVVNEWAKKRFHSLCEDSKE